MSFDSLDALLRMGGHGGYVWSAYAIALATFACNWVAPLHRRRQLRRRLQQLARRAEP